ncbi:MAG: hypothetical protein M1818_002121 [Claussenomyces sp. TS43310]|nr:MAG: hypothetical protein M1818_002121 [Claussenomyces sp. TS43310]
MAQSSVRSFRRTRHTELRPLTTDEANQGHKLADGHAYEEQVSGTLRAPESAISLASPTLVAVRQYYRDNGLSTTFQVTPAARRGTLPFPQGCRSSVLSPSGLASRLGRVNVSSTVGSVTPVSDTPEFRSMAEETRKQLLDGVNGGELERLGNVVARRNSMLLTDVIAQASGKVPFEYTHERLRQWGQVYLGNVCTADVFVRALYLRRSGEIKLFDRKLAGSSHTALEGKMSESITVRARVTPRAKERKPFLMQRKFNVEELRASLSSPVENKSEYDREGRKIRADDLAITHTRSKSNPSPLPAAPTPTSEATRRDSNPIHTPKVSGKRGMPIRTSP